MNSDSFDQARPETRKVDPVLEQGTATPTSPALSEAVTLPDQNAPHALVVDDDAGVRMVASDILEDAGFLVLAADHGDAAFELLKTRHADVVLLFTDVQMPGELDGFALARAVAAAWPHISIVVASGHARPGPGSLPDKARFIGKPFSADLVQSHVREILPNGQKPKQLRSS